MPITNRDLNSFVDQLHTVARQLSDAATARKFDTIAFSVKNLIRNELQKLSNIKNSILLKITMLEVLLPPLGKQANQSLAHLKSIQYFLDNEGWKLAEKVSDNNYNISTYMLYRMHMLSFCYANDDQAL